MCVCVCVCVCVRKRRKIELTAWAKKVPIPVDGIQTCTSGIRTHRASDYTTRPGTPRVSSNKHFRHSPTSSIVKHKHALRNTPTPICVMSIFVIEKPTCRGEKSHGEKQSFNVLFHTCRCHFTFRLWNIPSKVINTRRRFCRWNSGVVEQNRLSWVVVNVGMFVVTLISSLTSRTGLSVFLTWWTLSVLNSSPLLDRSAHVYFFCVVSMIEKKVASPSQKVLVRFWQFGYNMICLLYIAWHNFYLDGACDPSLSTVYLCLLTLSHVWSR